MKKTVILVSLFVLVDTSTMAVAAPAPMAKKHDHVSSFSTCPYAGTWRVRWGGGREVLVSFSPGGYYRETEEGAPWRGTWRYDGSAIHVKCRTNDRYLWCEWQITFPYLDKMVGVASGDCMTETTIEFIEKVGR